MGKIVNKKMLAEIVGVSERTLTEYQKQGMPILNDSGRGSENSYDTADVVKWLIDKAVNGKSESARERLDRVKADREELALAKDLEQLVPAEEVEKKLVSKVIATKSHFLSGMSKIKSELDAYYDIEIDIELLNEHAREILTQLSKDAGNTAEPS